MRYGKLLLYWTVVFSIFTIILMHTISEKDSEIKKLKEENINLRYKIAEDLRKQQLQLNELKQTYNQLKKKRFLTQSDIEALEKIVEAEAGNQGIRGKILVACVVLNRWNNSKNKTVNDIITSPGQFQPVSNGKYYSAVPTKETKEAVSMALYKDYTNGALYFLNPKISSRGNTNWFKRNLEYVTKHKDHEFYK